MSFLVYLSVSVQSIYFFGSYDFNFNFFAIFSIVRQTISALPVNFVAPTTITRFFSFNCLKVIYLVYKSINLPFSVKLPMVFIYKFCQKENLIQPLEEPREQHLDEF